MLNSHFQLSSSRQLGKETSAPISTSCSGRIVGSTCKGIYRSIWAAWRTSGATKGMTLASFGNHGEDRIQHGDSRHGGEEKVPTEVSASLTAGGLKGAPKRSLGVERRSSRSTNREVHYAMDLTRRIKSCRGWREVQALFEEEEGQYNEIHVSATVVAVRR